MPAVLPRLSVLHRLIWLLASLFLLAACSKPPPLPRLAAGDVVLAFGDSLTFGTGASPSEAYPAVLAGRIGHKVVNAGIPGETTADGRSRLPEVLEEARPKLMILCMGGNDFLRGAPEADTIANLRAMIELARSKQIAVLLIGVPKPSLTRDVPPLYASLAKEYKLPLEDKALPDILGKGHQKSDPIHPNAVGYGRFAEAIEQVMRQAGAI